MRRGYHLVALIAASMACMAFGMWLIALVLVAFAAALSARDVLDDELRAQRMAVVATTIPSDQQLDRVRLEQLVDDELRVLAGTSAAATDVLEFASAGTTDRWHQALIEDRLLRAGTGSVTAASESRTPNRWIVPTCVVLILTAGVIQHPLAMVLACAVAMPLLVVWSFPHVRASVTVAQVSEVVMPIGVEADCDDVEAVVQIRLRQIARGRLRPARRARRYADEPLAQRRLNAVAATSVPR